VTDHTHDVRLISFVIDGIAHGLAVYGQTLIFLSIGLVPFLKSAVQMHRVNSNKDIADDVETGHEIAVFFACASETLPCLLAEALGPVGDGGVTPHST